MNQLDTRQTAQTAPLHIQLLGGFRISRGPLVLDEDAWRLRTAASIVKLLALVPEHTRHREELMDLLWPELLPDAAANNLRYSLHIARRTLQPLIDDSGGGLKLVGQQIQLSAPGPICTDVEAFLNAVDGAETRSAWENALALYAGDLLPGDRYADWATARRESLRDTYLRGLIDLASLQEMDEDAEAAIASLQRVVEVDPTREEAHVGIMRLYATTGQRQLALRQYQRLRDAMRNELDIDPDPVSQQLYQAIMVGRFGSGVSPVEPVPADDEQQAAASDHNLPEAQDSFVGRGRQMDEINALLDATRFLTLIGSGGVGKTRLSLEVGRRRAQTRTEDIRLVDLAALVEPRNVPGAIASALNVEMTPASDVTSQLVGALKTAETLIILDNCEHLIEAVASVAARLVEDCPDIRILATSREPLRVSSEVTYRVPALALPEVQESPLSTASQSEAVHLFAQRAAERQRGFTLNGETLEPVARICRLVEGIPLAIELAAAATATIPVNDIAERLDAEIALPALGDPERPERHQTLDRALDWSFGLLDDCEQHLFLSLAVFAGSWTVEAAEAVFDGDSTGSSTFDLLASLVDKSLVTIAAGPLGLRYRMLAPVRQYALERLAGAGFADDVRLRHAHYFARFAEHGEPLLRGSTVQEWMSRFEAEYDNLRSALTWSLEHAPDVALLIAAGTGRFWYIRGYNIEGRDLLQRALRANPDGEESLRAKALTQSGILADEAGDPEEAFRLLDMALVIFQRAGDAVRTATVLNSLGAVARAMDNLELSEQLLEESLAIRQSLDDQRASNLVKNNLASVAWSRGNLDRAEALLRETLQFDLETGDEWSIALTLAYLGRISWDRRDYSDAVDQFVQSGRLATRVGDDGATVEAIEGVAGAVGAGGDPVAAARLFGAAEGVREAIGVPVPLPERAFHERMVEAARSRAATQAFTREWNAGRAYTLEDALPLMERVAEDFLAQAPPAPESPLPMEDLTAREREIVQLISRGDTNASIATELGIARRTVDTHVSRILRKLGVTSRTDITAEKLF